MPRVELTIDEVLAEVRTSLRTARMGQDGFLADDPARRLPGLRNAVVFGVASTIALQRLRGRAEGFQSWWEGKSNELRADADFQRLWKLRTEILKQGLGTSSIGLNLHIDYLNTADLEPLMKNPPPGAARFFIGDRSGGSGWSIERPDGLTEAFYVALPSTVRLSSSFSIDTGSERADVTRLLDRWLIHLDGIEVEARRRFARP